MSDQYPVHTPGTGTIELALETIGQNPFPATGLLYLAWVAAFTGHPVFVLATLSAAVLLAGEQTRIGRARRQRDEQPRARGDFRP